MDFPKTMWIAKQNSNGVLKDHPSLEEYLQCAECGELVAIYTLKEVKKKVTEVKLEDI